jgi:hypothetical protein
MRIQASRPETAGFFRQDHPPPLPGKGGALQTRSKTPVHRFVWINQFDLGQLGDRLPVSRISNQFQKVAVLLAENGLVPFLMIIFFVMLFATVS